jgi:ABC-type uncharacterized transport system auxiliary subunit
MGQARRAKRGGLGAAWLALLCSACIGGSSPAPVYYALEGAGDVRPRAQTGSKLAVVRFAARAPYDRSEVVYRVRTRELRYYPFDLWASKPGRMLAEAVAMHLRKTELFSDVSFGPVVGAADYELRGEVLSIEERDVDERSWRAHLAMRFELVQVATQEVVLRHEFDSERPVGERKVRAIAAALDAILAAELDRLSARIAEVLPPAR